MRKRKLAPHVVRRTKKKSKRDFRKFLVFLAIITLLVSIGSVRLPGNLPWEHAEPGTIEEREAEQEAEASDTAALGALKFEDVPEYSGSPYTEINGSIPNFTESEQQVLSISGYEYYSALDNIGRCGYAEACVGPETQPEEEERGDIYMVHPSGWRSGQGWERCHLIGWALTGENANDHNLVTGTHYMNVEGMLPFEIEVAEAADKGHHVMYRVTPIYRGYEPICRGVHMMARSIEDNSVSYNIFVYNVEPGKTVDYVSGYVR